MSREIQGKSQLINSRNELRMSMVTDNSIFFETQNTAELFQ